MSETFTLSSDAFLKMKRLRLLKILCQTNCYDLTYLSNELRLLDWEQCPLRSLPSSFKPKNLVILLLLYSNIEQLWKENIPLYKLKVLNLKGSENLIKAPDVTTTPNLEIFVLEGCTRLVYVHPSVGVLTRLKLLNLRGCKSLRSFPTRIGMESLEKLTLSGCSKLQSFPEIDRKMECLLELCFDGTNIKELPSSIGNLKRLKVLNLKDCKSLRSLPIKIGIESLEKLQEPCGSPGSIGGCKSLKSLNLSGCYEVEYLPENLQQIEFLEELDLSETSMTKPPPIIFQFKNLKVLSFNGCKGSSSKLQKYLPSLLKVIQRERTNSMAVMLTSLLGLSSLKQLNLRDCSLCEGDIPSDISRLSSLEELDLGGIGNSREKFDIILPGSEILEWFSQQRGDSSIKIDLPLEVRNDSQWMGVALCCVFMSDDASREEDLMCRAVIHDRYSRQANCTQSNFLGRDRRQVECSGWKTAGCLDQECHQLELFFERPNSVKVKKCGVRIVYERDLEEIEQIQELHGSQCCANFEDIQQHSGDDGSIGNGSLIKRKLNMYEEMDEGPQPKRMQKIFSSIMGRLGKKH
ncbi:hypothetical protein J1N35_023702 [Gossypium stocksii]|uniref:TMV resistance protein N-like n=1 Tax=Gossypium stocksii TaxID=47602 RepID=A0A9D3VJP5_9ROSI|nr:hypothetical protein J1N35_023702 [Gossypium stocksii]